MSESKANYQVGTDVLSTWKEDVLSGTPPTFYQVGEGELRNMEVGPGLISMFGGAPGAGKSALVNQLAMDGLRLNPELRIVMCNVEMSPTTLLDRQLARVSGIDLKTIRYRRLTEKHKDRLDTAMETLEPLLERLCFVKPPFNLENVADTLDAFDGAMVVIDYIQRVPPPGKFGDNTRGAVNATMDYLRKFADSGAAVMLVAAVSRTKDSKGRVSYDGAGLNLASFRESSELEFGVDDAYMLVADAKNDRLVTLRHLKARNGAAKDVALTFERKLQRFVTDDAAADAAADEEDQHSVLPAGSIRNLWISTVEEPCTTD